MWKHSEKKFKYVMKIQAKILKKILTSILAKGTKINI